MQRQYELIRIPEGTTTKITCQTTTVEEIIWLRGDQPIYGDSRFEMVSEKEKQHLIIHEAQLSDSAVYSIVQAGERIPVAELIVEGTLFMRACYFPWEPFFVAANSPTMGGG